MKKLLFLLVFPLFLASCGATNQNIVISDSAYSAKGQRPINPFPRLRVYYDGNGKEVSREENKKLYVQDGPDIWKMPEGRGTFKQYYILKDGKEKLKSEGGYGNNKLDGFFKEYYILEDMELNCKFDDSKLPEYKAKDGNLMVETNYSNGLENGIRKFYTIDGSLVWETNYSEGKKNGIERFYPHGKLYEETNYLNGEKHGISKLWNPDVDDWLYYDECIYKNGVLTEGQRHNSGKK